MLLSDRVAIVTGGAMGMGMGMAVRFAEEGCKVAVVDIRMEQADETVARIVQKGGEGIAVRCDVTRADQVQDAVNRVLRQFGKIDILVNNAGGILSSPPIEDMTEEEWDQTLALNLKSDFLFCKFAVPGMKKQGYGKIINVSSIGAVQPPHHAIHYNTAKSGIIGFTYDLANALAPLNITVNAILPGPVRTEFYHARTDPMSEKERDDFFAGLGKKVPMQRPGSPEDIAGPALFLASELSSYVTGQLLMVAGGLPLLPPSRG